MIGIGTGIGSVKEIVNFSLSVSLQAHLERSAMLHAQLCPRQVIGVRMARLACTHFGIDPDIERKKLLVYMETGHCAAAGVMVVTGASPLNGYMKLMDYGRVAATFVDLRKPEYPALRVEDIPESRDKAVALMPHLSSSWQAQLQAYQVMADADLLRWRRVQLRIPVELPGEKARVTCEQCGAVVHDGREVVKDGRVLCRVCGGAGYYV